MKTHLILAAIILVLLGPTAIAADTPTRVPVATRPVMIDGTISQKEWSDAAQLPLGDFARVYVKQTPEHVWIALELLKPPSGTLDLFLAPAKGRPADLHASAKLGQRILTASSWPEDWHWWNNDGWVANVSRVDSWQKRNFLDEKVREYQIDRSWFPSKDFQLMFEIMTPAEPSWQTTKFPPNASNTDPKTWFALRLN